MFVLWLVRNFMWWAMEALVLEGDWLQRWWKESCHADLEACDLVQSSSIMVSTRIGLATWTELERSMYKARSCTIAFSRCEQVASAHLFLK